MGTSHQRRDMRMPFSSIRDGGREDNAFGPDQFVVRANRPAVGERRVSDAPVKGSADADVEALDVQRASIWRKPLREEIRVRPRVEHNLARKREHARV